jgi:glycine/D-amino acid oxidase-like deaminating enzyme
LAGRLTIIGGGVMGLMTAYQAALLAESVTVLDRSRVGDPATASFGLTRSVRNDYPDVTAGDHPRGRFVGRGYG